MHSFFQIAISYLARALDRVGQLYPCKIWPLHPAFVAIPGTWQKLYPFSSPWDLLVVRCFVFRPLWKLLWSFFLQGCLVWNGVGLDSAYSFFPSITWTVRPIHGILSAEVVVGQGMIGGWWWCDGIVIRMRTAACCLHEHHLGWRTPSF